MNRLMIAVVVTATTLLSFATPAQASPGYGDDCLMPSVETCRILPDPDGPHMVEQYCPGQGYISVFAPCVSRFGPYGR